MLTHGPRTKCIAVLAAAAGFSLAMNALMLTIPLYSVQTFDRVLTSRSLETLFYLTLIAVLALGVLAALDAVRSQLLARLGVYLETTASGPALNRRASAAE